MTSDKAPIDIRVLKDLKEINPLTHAGCYELVQKAVGLYGKMEAPNNLTVADLDMIISFTQIGWTFKGLKTNIDKSSLPDESKKSLNELLSSVEEKYNRGEYRNIENSKGVGLVSRVGGTFAKHYTPTPDEISRFLLTLVNILSKDSSEEVCNAAMGLPQIKDVKIGTISPILHCLKPDVFPIWNDKSGNFFPKLPITPRLPKTFSVGNYINEYVEASKRLNEFRENNGIKFKNWRAVDILAYSDSSSDSKTAKNESKNAGKSSSVKTSGDLKESFRSWLVENLNSKPEGRNKLANLYVERIEKLAEHQTGKSPTVGIFAVRTSKQFDSFYKSAIEWALNYDKEGHRYWKQPITHYVRFLQDYFNPVSGSGSLSYVELKDENDVILPRNLIYFGAPGTGKSFKLKEAVEAKRDENGKPVEEDKNGTAIDYERVTFYPTYSYAQFVGCYKPVMKPADGGKEEIAYQFVPGPFLRMLVKALEKPNENHCLVIEEINRANAAAVFGDVFQLLDRGGKWSDGDDESIKPFFGDGAASEYDVAASEDIKRYLKEELAKCESARKFLKVVPGKDENGNNIWKECRLRIPSNMYIWATMNSADQGVFPMDTAFKRRWEFKYVGINDEVTNELQTWTIGENGFLWNKVRTFLNQRLTDNRVNEDKLMGPWFVKPENGIVASENQFKSKVLMYLWEDAARMCRRKFFGESINTYSDLKDQWPDVFGSPEGWGETKKSWKRSNQEENQEDKKPSEPGTQSPEDGTEAVRT